MKYFYLLLIFFVSTASFSQIINFPDIEFKNKLLSASPTNPVAKDSAGDYVAIDINTDNEIDVSEALLIYELDVKSSNLTDLTGLDNFVNLTRLEINLNEITTFDATPHTNLEYLNFSNNLLTSVDLTGLSNLQILWAYGNPFTSVDISSLSALDLIDISYSDNLTALDASNLTNLTNLSASSNDSMTSINLSGCTALEDLDVQYSALTSLDLSGLTSLSTMFAEDNNITTIDVTGAVSLGNLNVAFNQITSLVVEDLPVLQSISASGNLINNLVIQNCPFFFTLVMGDNELTTLDLSNVPNATIVEVPDNSLEELILAENNEIVQINLANNLLTEINLNSCINLNWGSFNDNPNLESILLKNGSFESLFNININNLPNLQYVCSDVEQINDVQTWLTNNGYSNVNLNTYCSFTPGGEIFEIQGMSRFDFDTNSCSVSDPIVPFMSYTIDDGTTTSTGFAGDTGFYYIPVQDGTYTITPNNPNPALYDVNPTNFTVTFPGSASPFEQDLCFEPNSVVNDLQVVITPLTPARPGFDADYQLLVTNVGNQVLSGDVQLTYLEDFVTYVDSDIPYDASDINSFTWNFTDLYPFQSFSVEISFNINPPTDPNFPVNIDDVLTYTAVVNPITDDANPADNTFILDQVVVGSFDPNDIQCLEGAYIPVDDIGEYVHYRIRFENTGTFNAENIVVKNIIDTQSFDLSSFKVLSGSHEFVTQITGDQIEFIFEGIDLPFDDENNDGFVLYKIKTLPTLQEGDVFSNSAEIYFDFNFPIETNTYNTTIGVPLSISEYEFSNRILLYPNPANTFLYLDSSATVKSYEIFDLLGQKILSNPNVSNGTAIDISELNVGNYFIKILTNRGTAFEKFIKN
tara:strand:+ start:32856 stop:35453 length:2598 start_codon:yes stop_codon:yes gene_type:complete